MNIPELHRRAVDYFGSLVHRVGDNQWGSPTPCTEWDVRALVNHLVYENRWTVPLMEGRTIEEVGDRFEGDLLGLDPKAAWDEASEQAVNAVQADGAMVRTVHLSFGYFPGEEYARQLFTDHLIHGWDLARGIGAEDTLDHELAEACFEINKPQEDSLKSSGAFGEKIEPDPGADLQTKLLAVFGRKR